MGCMIMKRIVALFILFLCIIGNANAAECDETYLGMSYQDIRNLFTGFQFDKDEYVSGEFITASKEGQRITLTFTDDSLTFFRAEIDGENESDMNFFFPDWDIGMDEMLDLLGSMKIIHSYTGRTGKDYKTNQNKKTYGLAFCGEIENIQLFYNLKFDENKDLTEIVISGEDYISILTYLGSTLGSPLSIDISDYRSGEPIENSIVYYDECYWIHQGNKYTFELETEIDVRMGEEEFDDSIEKVIMVDDLDRSPIVSITKYAE